MLLSCLNNPEKQLIQKVFSIASAKDFKIYLVGGTVRNIILGEANIKDIDFAVEEEKACELAYLIVKEINGEVIKNKKFNNAKIITLNGIILDFVSTRTERYPRNGALPLIKKGTIKEDLQRRDFTINAMALTFGEEKDENLLDYYNGLEDLQNKKIRILHRKSFLEDPTRIIRAARFQCRLGFQLEEETVVNLKHNVKYIQELTPERTRSEFKKILMENNPEEILKQLDEWKAIDSILPGINIENINCCCLNDLQKYYFKKNNINICLISVMLIYWFCAFNIKDVLKVKLIFSNKEKKTLQWLIDNKNLIDTLMSESKKISAIELYYLFKKAVQDIEVFIYCLIGERNKSLLEYIKKIRRGTELPINGNDVLLAGFTSGPQIGELLKLLEQEVVEGKIYSKRQALKWLERMKKEC